ncbi:hypothetical protein PWJ57_05510 [Fructilactobacillus sanfranciscensis]|uniref:hypothetical protein n=1 Tax=Fructilactobacillus sanfranciscensis TaxID=1625 RepID=UPI0031FA3F91
MNKFLIDVFRGKSNNADNKPKTDINRILKEKENFNLIYIKKFKKGKIDRNFLVKYRINKALKGNVIQKDDVVLVHYPFYSGRKFEEYLVDVLDKIGAKKIALIHDLDSLRFDKSLVFGDINGEVGYLNKYDVVISHNPSMTKLLIDKGLRSKIVNIGLFDYLNDDKKTNSNGYLYKNRITFAGNLNKSPFLGKLNVYDGIKFDVFGNINDPSSINKTLTYNGSVSPKVLSQKLGKGYGLVWDGESLEKPSGMIGNYLLYNNPYKASSYLSAGMPLIVWDKSAISKFVKENNIGISVSNIKDLSKELSLVSADEFNEMCKNAFEVSKSLKNGLYTISAVDSAIDKLG